MYTLRKPTEADYACCKDIGHEGLKPCIQELFGWDQEKEDAGFKSHWDLSLIKIILLDKKIAGYIKLEERKLEDKSSILYIDGIYISSVVRNLGLGKQVLVNTIRNSNIPVRLQVYKINPSHKLYCRLGFNVTSESDLRYYMEYKP